MVVLEGRQSVLAALQARQRRIQVVLVRRDTPPARVQDVLETAVAAGIAVRHVDAAELDALAHGVTHGGVIAVCVEKPRWDAAQLLDQLRRSTATPFLLVLEGVDDARNLGFTIRTAEAMGCFAVLVKKHLWDFDETQVARSASGAYERLPLVQFDNLELLAAVQKLGIALLGCLAGVKRTIYDVDLSHPVALAIGGEKRGLSGAVRGICDQFVAIPTAGGASSLSLSHAGAIVLAEAFRQRRATPPVPAGLAGVAST